MALTITNAPDGSPVLIPATTGYIDIPTLFGGFTNEFQAIFDVQFTNTTARVVLLGNATDLATANGWTNNPYIRVEPNNGRVDVFGAASSKVAFFPTIDFTERLLIDVERNLSGELVIRVTEVVSGTTATANTGSYSDTLRFDRAFGNFGIPNLNPTNAYSINTLRSSVPIDRFYNVTQTNGTTVPDTNGGTAGTLVGTTNTYAPIFTFGDNITYTTGLTGLTRTYIEDTQGNEFDLTGVTDTNADVPVLVPNLNGCLMGVGTLNVTDGVSTESAPIELGAPSGYDLTDLTETPPVELATNWTFGFDTAAAIGDQSFENSADITHNTNGSITWTPQALTYTYYTIDASDGVISEITKTFDEEGVLVGIPAESRTPPWKLAQYLRENESLEGSTNDVIFKWLEGQGYTGALNDMWMQYWEAQGYTGSYSDMRYKWLKT